MSSSELSSVTSDPIHDASTAATSPQEYVATSTNTKKRKAMTPATDSKRVKTSKSVVKRTETTPRKRTTQSKEVKIEVEVEDTKDDIAKSGSRRGKKTTKTDIQKEATDVDSEGSEPAITKKKTAPKKRKTKEEKEAEKMPLVARTVGSKIVAGAHVSVAGGVQNAVINSLHIGGNAFALFLKSQRKWTNPPLKAEDALMYKAHCKEHGIHSDKHVVPHGSYLVNLAHTDADRTAQAYESFLDDLKRCHQLGIKLYNFHPGNCASSTREEALRHLAHQLNRAHKDPDTGNVITVLETMASAGNTIGSTFTELASIIKLVNDKSRVAVCLDTCHVFAAGYDLRTPEAFKSTIEKFDKEVGLQYLRAFHVNDSKAPLSSHKDLHANIGTGFLGLRAFHNLVNEPRLWGLPLVLETPIGVKNESGKEVDDHGIYAREIKLLESLVGMDPESSEFLELESALHAKGESERARIQDQVDRKAVKDKKGATKKSGKPAAKGAKKKKKVETSDEGSGEDTA